MRLNSRTILAELRQWPQLDTSHWRSPCAVTLALKQTVWSWGSRFQLDEVQAKRTFRHFMKLLNGACYGTHWVEFEGDCRSRARIVRASSHSCSH
jgi:hypothetical protein